MTFPDVIKSIPGLTHYYPLATDTKDTIGTQNGTPSGVTFSGGKAVFNGKASINLGDHNDFSVATKGGLSIVVFLTIDNWKGAGATEYVHWTGKGKSGAHEYTFRHYVQGGSGEASTRQGRCSFYHFNPDGGLGAGSYYQDSSFPTNERVLVGMCDMTNVSLACNGAVKDKDALSGYSIKPQNTTTPLMLGTRGDNTGFLVGKIRRVAIYNRVLTATELTKIYNARDDVEGTTPSTPTTPTESPYHAADTTDVVDKHNALVAALEEKGVV
jgi:hypothetical protein